MDNTNKYQNSKIYKLISDETDLIYIGSTSLTRLCERMSAHRRAYRGYINDTAPYYSGIQLLQYEDCRIVLLECFSCTSRDELRARERYWIEQNRELCVNINTPGTTVREQKSRYYEQNKEYIAEQKSRYYEQNKEYIAEQNRQYYEDNKDSVSEYKKQYYEGHIEHITEYKRQHYDSNRERLLQKQNQYYDIHKETIKAKQRERVMCECGAEIRRGGILKHRKTATHAKKMSELAN